MFSMLKSRLLAGIQTKVGLAIIGALVLGGGGTALAMTAAHGQLPNLGAAASPTAHSGDDSSNAGKDDQDDKACTGTPTTSDASPTAHSGDDSSSATRTPDQDDHEGNETECEKGDGAGTPEPTERPEGTHTPEPTERPEGTHTPEPNGTPGGD
jgi:hypothetical protein